MYDPNFNPQTYYGQPINLMGGASQQPVQPYPTMQQNPYTAWWGQQYPNYAQSLQPKRYYTGGRGKKPKMYGMQQAQPQMPQGYTIPQSAYGNINYQKFQPGYTGMWR